MLCGGFAVVWSSLVDLECVGFAFSCTHCYGRWHGVYLVQLEAVFLVTDEFGLCVKVSIFSLAGGVFLHN